MSPVPSSDFNKWSSFRRLNSDTISLKSPSMSTYPVFSMSSPSERFGSSTSALRDQGLYLLVIDSCWRLELKFLFGLMTKAFVDLVIV